VIIVDSEIIFSGDLQEMAADDIINYVDPATYNQIKRTDKKPLFKVFSLGHEGESEGKVLGVGNVVKRWVKSVIQMMHDKLKIGTKVFLHHNNDNSHQNRTPIGRLVGKALETLSNGLNALGVVYIDPSHREIETDVASIEAGFTWSPITKEIKSISDITGIALGNSDNMQPGFRGAVLQAQLQEFHDKHTDGGVVMNIDEIRKAVKEGKLTPLDIFDRPDIESVEFVKGYRAANKRLYEKNEELSAVPKKVEDLKSEYENRIKEKEDIITGYKRKENKQTAKKKLDEILKERKGLSEKHREFIKLGFDEFNVNDPEKVGDELNQFADKRVEKYKQYVKSGLIPADKSEGDKADDDNQAPAPPHSTPSGKIEYDDLGNIKGTNPFIKNLPKS
jgi:hypothetical protein